MLEAFNPDNAPKVLGPYSHAIRAGDFLYVSGQLPINPESGQIESLDIEAQTEQVLKNIEIILKAAGAKFENVARCDIFLKNLRDFSKVNSIYGDCFRGACKPARQTIEVSKLPLDALIEISCIAYLGN